LESARLGAKERDPALLGAALETAGQVQALSATLAGQPVWPGFAAAAAAEALAANGDAAGALGIATQMLDYAARQVAGENGVAALLAYMDILLPIARVLAASEDHARADVGRSLLAQVVGLVAERTADPGVFERWLSVPEHAELAEIAGGVDAARAAVLAMPETIIQQRLPVLPLDLTDDEAALMKLMMEGRSDFEIARELSLDEGEVARRLEDVFAKIGAPNRSVATLYAFMADLA
jgi:DNA-binding NarL/FixJ family response regulator